MQVQYDFRVDFHSDLKTELTDENVIILLFESVRELLFNAIKYSGEKQADVKLRQAKDNSISIIVRDKGRGFVPPAAGSPQSVESFGLFSIEERLNYFGGSMDITSSPGHGTTITLTVPPLDDKPPLLDRRKVVPVTRRTKKSRPQEDSAMCRLVIVDDHKIMREGLVSLFELEADIEVIGEAADGPSAIALCARLKPNVVLMDINLSGMDGIEATRQIVKNHPEIKVVGLSMFLDDEVARAMGEAGAAGFLTKGVPSAQVLSAIRTVMGDK